MGYPSEWGYRDGEEWDMKKEARAILNKIEKADKLDRELRSIVAEIDNHRNKLTETEKDISRLVILETTCLEYPNTANTSRDLRHFKAIIEGLYK